MFVNENDDDLSEDELRSLRELLLLLWEDGLVLLFISSRL
jgi:hypothetical protein